jgi:ribosomal protein S18 acetylase RimI-like enzyme
VDGNAIGHAVVLVLRDDIPAQPPEKMQIRLATPGDSLKVAEVHLATWRSAYAGIVSQEYLDSFSIEQRKNRWDEILQRKDVKEKTLVAEVDDEVVGFLSAGPNRTPGLGFGGEIYALYLSSDFHKKGFGARLLKRGMAELREMEFKDAVVWVLQDNPSRHFYERMGGRKVEEMMIRIGEQDLKEVAYGWDSISDGAG